MRIPRWFPGADFQVWAHEGKELFFKLTRTPFYAAKAELEIGRKHVSFVQQSLEDLEKEHSVEDEDVIMFAAGSLLSGKPIASVLSSLTSLLKPGQKLAILHDEKTYNEPEKFMPERFLVNRLGTSAPDPRELVYGFGRSGASSDISLRRCPGAHLADFYLFLVVARILALYEIVPVNPNDPPHLEFTASFAMCSLSPLSAGSFQGGMQSDSCCKESIQVLFLRVNKHQVNVLLNSVLK
ncbi:hypothetical protein C0993_007649 [Termitomyces sp. T159_Od127]|nr:hypothetical protein C0993_007649 [Termitomyces sp. T159_Od127]